MTSADHLVTPTRPAIKPEPFSWASLRPDQVDHVRAVLGSGCFTTAVVENLYGTGTWRDQSVEVRVRGLPAPERLMTRPQAEVCAHCLHAIERNDLVSHGAVDVSGDVALLGYFAAQYLKGLSWGPSDFSLLRQAFGDRRFIVMGAGLSNLDDSPWALSPVGHGGLADSGTWMTKAQCDSIAAGLMLDNRIPAYDKLEHRLVYKVCVVDAVKALEAIALAEKNPQKHSVWSSPSEGKLCIADYLNNQRSKLTSRDLGNLGRLVETN